MAKKIKTAYFCQNCGFESPKWQGKCPACNEWNTFVEELQKEEAPKKGDWKMSSNPKSGGYVNVGAETAKPTKITEVKYEKEARIITLDEELNRVLGGGIVPGSVVMIGGEPGIGKSTLMLQIALSLNDKQVLYVSGEESGQQIRQRAERIPFSSEETYVLTETDTSKIFAHVEKMTPDVMVIDSIQTLVSPFLEQAAGSVSQVKECAAELIRFAKDTGTPVLMIGHITKEGSLAGPKVLEHMVDTVLQFEGDRHMSYRILRTAKNRFGSTSELGIYEMISSGLRQVSNPSEILLSQRDDGLSGIAIGTVMEGNRPLLVEIQSLVTPSVYGNPQRSSTGFDAKRLNMLLAVLEKRSGYKLNFSDVFINITGGLRVEDPAIDLAVVVSLISSFEDIAIESTTCFAAEVGLGGEVRAVSRIENRISEAEKLGFKEMFISKYNTKGIDFSKLKMKVIPVGTVAELAEKLFT
ncbi:DNA repair protein RadA [Flammeovirga yaeyamensis]|uniref:DNA repair protein RadA n=1 Tax=Flammeovirga yaeyamensis TaxID=367791 RepID=A0AAX1N8C5_9BACT|nr:MULTISPECIES: DNA repair protein RadA [Flammeovirga]ANQ48725.1 DNA repair protein RadA [Flammeovirga sp. MY04]MBB3698806.1 DNA repair protein RadA/Sms [Flammeovirga yaeyamensis]NMF37391.1 DNA repair protein RadA [Flammeovirga yaeyamensis]QWG03795.1 DNA repair protein RadA [Flammeovirga yaeyamensis]